jgi:hypothetical protein
MTDAKITIEFEHEVRHIQDFYVYHNLYSKEGKRALLKLRIFLFTLVFVISLLLTANYDKSYTLSGAFNALIFSGLVFLLVMRSNIPKEKQIRKRIIKFLNKPENKKFLEHVKLEFDTNGISTETSNSKSYYKWDCIVNVVSNDRYFYLYINEINAIIIPKNVFANDLDKQMFVELLNEIQVYDKK